MAEMTGFQRLIGGLLGENMEGMTEEQRRRLAREGGTAAILGMLSGSGLLGGLEGLRARRKEQATEAEAARRTAAAEAEMPRIAGRLFGGTAGTLESLPGGEGGPLTSRYRQAPQEALARLYSTQEGRDVATMAPGLATLAEGMVKEKTGMQVVGGEIYDRATGRFITPPKEEKPRVRVGETDLTDKVIVFYSDGTTETFPKGAAPRAAGGGGGGGGGGGAGGGGGGQRFKILTPEEVIANNLKPGIYQQNTDTGQITPMQGQDSGGIGEVELRQYNAASLAIKNARSNIQNFADTLARVSAAGAIAGEGRGELESSYTLALGAVRELQNSGVLNVGEIPFLEKALRDPTTFSAIAASPVRRKELAGQIRTIMNLLNQREKNLRSLYPQAQLPTQNEAPPPTNPAVPTNQNRAPGPEARSRAENYYSEGD